MRHTTSMDRAAGASLLIPMGIAAGAGALGLLLGKTILARRRHFNLDGKTAIVTGGSRGIGLEISRELLRRGARVTICARDENEMRAALDDLGSDGGEVLAVTCDVTQQDEIENVVERTREAFGPIDVLVNNAGLICVGSASAMKISDYRDAMDTNFEAPLLFMLDVIPEMRERRQGRIVNVASFGGKVPAPHMAAYCASKFALVGLSGTLRTELAQDNVYITTVCPGLVRSGSSGHAKFKGEAEKEHAWFAAAGTSRLLTISPESLARKIVDGLVEGRADVTTPLSARIESKLHGLLPNISAEVTTLLNHFLPRATSPTRAYTGAELAGSTPDLIERREKRSARSHNELDPE